MLDTLRHANVRPRSTATNVYEMLRSDIVLGVLRPQQPIREADIAASLSVSRTPVREALLRLANLGLVEIFPQSGTVVAPIRVEKVKAAQLIREVVEVEISRRACQAVNQADLDALAGNRVENARDLGVTDRAQLFAATQGLSALDAGQQAAVADLRTRLAR